MDAWGLESYGRLICLKWIGRFGKLQHLDLGLNNIKQNNSTPTAPLIDTPLKRTKGVGGLASIQLGSCKEDQSVHTTCCTVASVYIQDG